MHHQLYTEIPVITGEAVSGQMVESDDGYQCVGGNDCIPIRLYTTNRILKEKKGPDAVIKAFVREFIYYGYFSNSDYANVGIRLSKSENMHLFRMFGSINE